MLLILVVKCHRREARQLLLCSQLAQVLLVNKSGYLSYRLDSVKVSPDVPETIADLNNSQNRIASSAQSHVQRKCPTSSEYVLDDGRI